MTGLPAYFERIRNRASQRWTQLESDDGLAGPWRLLFKQVQSPRHVLSELLQNADDAGATKASVRIENEVFVFEHNGEDFAEEDFESLCGFGHSNKRTLHTIGFRGIGFKSTFSLGDRVELLSPTLSVHFDQKRFTEPVWSVPKSQTGPDTTTIRVAIKDQHRRQEIERNLDEWIGSPVSLLFFTHIRHLTIGERELRWDRLGPGPANDSLRMALSDTPDDEYLLIRSRDAEFPPEAIAEVRDERLLPPDEEGSLPPCSIDLVLGKGVEGRLYVVLPTGVITQLPFACNAPFIQDPARVKIKSPETSPTNRWLLERAGNLAASAMLEWLSRGRISMEQRSKAYDLLPDVDRDDTSLEGSCAAIMERAADSGLVEKKLVLTFDGKLVTAGQAVSLPDEILDVWPPTQASTILDEAGRAPLARIVTSKNRQKLLNWRLVTPIEKRMILDALKMRDVPRPTTQKALLSLWKYLAPEITSFGAGDLARKIRIVPVHGSDSLHAGEGVLRLGEQKTVRTEEDWQFLASHVVVLDHHWPAYLTGQMRKAGTENDKQLGTAVRAAEAVLNTLGLLEATPAKTLFDRVATQVFADPDGPGLEICVRLAQIAAKLGVPVSESFQYVTRDVCMTPVTEGVLHDDRSELEGLLPPEYIDGHVLHPEYTRNFRSCTAEEWKRWITSANSGVAAMPTLEPLEKRFWYSSQLELEVRGLIDIKAVTYPYQTDRYYAAQTYHVSEFDFPVEVVAFWEQTPVGQEGPWRSVAERMLNGAPRIWKDKQKVILRQTATNGKTVRAVKTPPVPATWVRRLANKPCLRDTRGFYRRPEELLRRTPQTETLIDVEPFLENSLDTEENRPLLDLLGVRSTPPGPNRLLVSMRALSKAPSPPLSEVEKWYRQLDRFVGECSTDNLTVIQMAFRTEKLIFTNKNTWERSTSVFLSDDHDGIPGAPAIRETVRDLTLWNRIGVAEKPTPDLILRWLGQLSSGRKIPETEVARVESFLARFPVRVWTECGHWLNLSGEWTPTTNLRYAVESNSRFHWDHLFERVKAQSADLRCIPRGVAANAPFSSLKPLGSSIEDRFISNTGAAGPTERRGWLNALGSELSRVELDTDEETERVRCLARDLAESSWQVCPDMRIEPCIDGQPVGTPTRAEVVWQDRVVYVNDLPKARLARFVPQQIGRVFARADVQSALDYAFERSALDIREYIEENFDVGELTLTLDGLQHTGNEMNPADEGHDGHDLGESIEEPSDDEDLADHHGIEHPRSGRRGPDIMGRFAKASGFERQENCYIHVDGSSIARTQGDLFPWEQRSPGGMIVRRYLPREKCLKREPVKIPVEIWWSIQNSPDTASLIVLGEDRHPVEMRGSTLLRLREESRLKVTASDYRLIMEYDDD